MQPRSVGIGSIVRRRLARPDLRYRREATTMADTINTKRNYRAEARPVFEDMRRILERIRDDEDLQRCMSVDLARDLDEVLDRARAVPFFV